MGMAVCIGLASYAGCRPSYPPTPIFQIGIYGRLSADTSPFLTTDRPSGCTVWALPADGFSVLAELHAWFAGRRWRPVGICWVQVSYTWCNGYGFDFKAPPLALRRSWVGWVRTYSTVLWAVLTVLFTVHPLVPCVYEVGCADVGWPC
jgi:hypothetical protein